MVAHVSEDGDFQLSLGTKEPNIACREPVFLVSEKYCITDSLMAANPALNMFSSASEDSWLHIAFRCSWFSGSINLSDYDGHASSED
jgi:hypothetical protein